MISMHRNFWILFAFQGFQNADSSTVNVSRHKRYSKTLFTGDNLELFN